MTTLESSQDSTRVLMDAAGTTHTGASQVPAPLPEAKAKPVRIRRQITDEQICVLTFDRPDSSANIFDLSTLTELNEHLDAIENDAQMRGLVLTSAKKSIFIAGADLHSLSQGVDTEGLRGLIELGQSVFNRIAALRI